MSNQVIADLSRMSAEEVYGPDMTELLNTPFPEDCVLCHEADALPGSKFCGVCLGGEN